MIPFMYFTYWSSSRHLNYLICEIIGQRNPWFEVLAVFVIENIESFPTLVRNFP